MRQAMRIGIGYDIHRLKEGRAMMIGGVKLPCVKGPDGHSDGDALLHSVCDAMLGAMGQGDIGMRFPDTDPKYKDIPSIELLKNVVSFMGEKGFALDNLDCTVIVEEPKIGPYRKDIVKTMSDALGVPENMVNVKAKTAEGMGSVGEGHAIAAYASVLIMKNV